MTLFGTMNFAMFDYPWSFVHAASGIGLAIGLFFMRSHHSTRQRWVIGVSLLAVWEVFEAGAAAAGILASESMTNIVGDMVIGTLGLLAAWAVLRLSFKSRLS